MKRLDFLKEMGGSLFETVKSVYEPFLKEDLEKVEDAADRVLGIEWHPLDSQTENLELRFIGGRPVILFSTDTNMQAFSSICPVCSNIITLTTLYSSGKCLNCEKEYYFFTGKGELKLEELSVKKRNSQYFVGFQKIKKQGGSHA